jgi:hypothetical protein
MNCHPMTVTEDVFARITEQCSLLLPLLWGAGPMALMLWLDGMMMMMMFLHARPKEAFCRSTHAFFYWCQFVDLQQAHAAIQAQPPRQNHKCKTTVAKLHPEFSNKQ